MSSSPLAPSGLPDAAHIRVDGVSRAFPDRRVLTDISLRVSSGERACLIGENGSGKSTLLRIVAGLDLPDAGSVCVPGSVGLYHQQPPFEPAATIEAVLHDATQPLRELRTCVEREGEALARGEAGSSDRFDAALAQAHRRGAWELEQLTERVVDVLGLAGHRRAARAGELSGGELARLCLGWVLLRHPDTVLLDEPTNHLDDRAARWVGDLLSSWPGPVLMASHDRAFIDEFATTLVDLDPAPVPHAVTGGDPGAGYGVTRFTGSYTAYLGHRRDVRDRWERRHRAEQDELERLRAKEGADHRVGHPERAPRTEGRASRKFYADRAAKVVSRRVGDAAAARARLESGQVRKPPAELRFGGAAQGRVAPPAAPGPVLVATELAVSGRLDPTSLSIGARSRLLVTGVNGCGKSTLLEVLAGVLAPDAGSLTTAARLSIGLLGQNTPRRDPDATVAGAYQGAVGERLAQEVPLSAFGLLAGEHVEQRRLADLSVGQRRRLDLAVVLAAAPDVLLLDEPTNHLSLLLATELEASLEDYPGAVVLASHDRWLRERWTGQRMALG